MHRKSVAATACTGRSVYDFVEDFLVFGVAGRLGSQTRQVRGEPGMNGWAIIAKNVFRGSQRTRSRLVCSCRTVPGQRNAAGADSQLITF